MARRNRFTRKEKLRLKLKKLAPDADDAMADATIKAGEMLADAIAKRAPVRTGRLRDSITSVVRDENRATSVLVGAKRPDGAALHLVEFGTAARYNADGHYTGIMPAQPFFFPTYRVMRSRIKSRITRAASKAIKQRAAK